LEEVVVTDAEVNLERALLRGHTRVGGAL